MNKVLCINDNWKKEFSQKDLPSPYVGEQCKVVGSIRHCGDMYYQLSGRFDKSSWFRSTFFAVVSDIDEKSFSRNLCFIN